MGTINQKQTHLLAKALIRARPADRSPGAPGYAAWLRTVAITREYAVAAAYCASIFDPYFWPCERATFDAFGASADAQPTEPTRPPPPAPIGMHR